MIDDFIRDLEDLLHGSPMRNVDISPLITKYTEGLDSQQASIIRGKVLKVLRTMEDGGAVELDRSINFYMNAHTAEGYIHPGPIHVSGTHQFELRLRERVAVPSAHIHVTGNNNTITTGNNHTVTVHPTEDQLPTKGALKGEENENPEKEKTVQKKSATLLDISKSLRQTGFLFFEHWVCNIKIKGMSIPPAKIYSSLEEFLNKREKRLFLSVFSRAFQKKVDGREAVFYQAPSATGVVDHSDERILRMSNGILQYEYAQYRPKFELFSPFNDELLTTTVLIFFCQWLYAAEQMDIDVEATITTNGRLVYLYGSQSASSIISVLNSTNVYELDPKDVHFSRTLRESSNDSLRGLYEELTYGMVTKDDHPFVGRPFMELKVTDQYMAFEYLRKLLLG